MSPIWRHFLSHGPCFHHLTHRSEHFNKAVRVPKRSLAGLDDTPINQACRASLLRASDSGDRGKLQTKAERAGDSVKRASVYWRRTCSLTPVEKSIRRLLIANLSKVSESPPQRVPKQSPVGLCLPKGSFCVFCLLHFKIFKWFIYSRQICTLASLELHYTDETRTVCLCFLGAEIKAVFHHA